MELLKRWIALGGALLALGLAWDCARADAVQEIERVEDQRYEAMIKADWGAFAGMLAEEFLYHQPSGRVSDKQAYVAYASTGDIKIKKAERYDVKIHVYGDVATAMGSTRLDIEQKGEPRAVDLRYLNVWVKRDGRWQLAARQSAFKQ
ncbi:MAG TPA: nuclear transport factor 2 family protein [Burkholderiales bacterium]|jgi:ketosteroid isomerase-like protein|nr:nuclear transport factor 2 family protein [Burkholderiales bacterium]